MIKLTRLKGDDFYLNPDLIETIEETPDTVITLVDGKKVIVAEDGKAVADRIVVFRSSVLAVLAKMEALQAVEDRP